MQGIKQSIFCGQSILDDIDILNENYVENIDCLTPSDIVQVTIIFAFFNV